MEADEEETQEVTIFAEQTSVHFVTTRSCLWRPNKRVPARPDDVEDGGAEELVVDGRRHVARLVEGGGYSAHGVAEVHAPQQEQELSCGTQKLQLECVLDFCFCKNSVQDES